MIDVGIVSVELTRDAMADCRGAEPSLFLTFDFFEHETQATPLRSGPRVVFNSSAEYVVEVNEALLHYLHNTTMTLELHQSMLVPDYR